MVIPRGVASRVAGAWETADGSALLRIALSPLAGIYGGAVRLRNAAYDLGVLACHAASIPVVSVGNLSVGGTGKTPIAASLARRLADLGHCPAVVLRGYGEDEALLHAEMNPDVPVMIGADRVDVVRRAALDGRGVAVLDDGFQHRRLRRDLDVVLVSADAFVRMSRGILPAGPYREPLRSVQRADRVLITYKVVSRETAFDVADVIRGAAQDVPVSFVELRTDGSVPLQDPRGRVTPLTQMEGQHVLALSSVADPVPFQRVLEEAGAIVEPLVFPDHHRYTARDADRIAAAARGRPVITTGKDAVKLRSVAPEGLDVHVVRQQVRFEDPAELDRVLEEVIRAA